MKVRLIKKLTVEDFAEDHSNGRTHFYAWLYAIKQANWEEPQDIIMSYRGNLLGGNRVVFDLGGNGPNAYRIICTFIFAKNIVLLYINWIGTHEEYNSLKPKDKLDVWEY